jgi:hypothetical protein
MSSCQPAQRPIRQAGHRRVRPTGGLAAEAANFATANPSGGGLADIQCAARNRGLRFALNGLFP